MDLILSQHEKNNQLTSCYNNESLDYCRLGLGRHGRRCSLARSLQGLNEEDSIFQSGDVGSTVIFFLTEDDVWLLSTLAGV